MTSKLKGSSQDGIVHTIKTWPIHNNRENNIECERLHIGTTNTFLAGSPGDDLKFNSASPGD